MAIDQGDSRDTEIEGTRITVYTLLPYLLDPTATEAYICQVYDLRPEQVAAARAYALTNAEIVLAKHAQIEARLASGNPTQVVEGAKEARKTLMGFKEWLAQREAEPAEPPSHSRQASGRTDAEGLLTFKQWLAERESRPREGP